MRDVDAWRVPHADGSLAFERFQNVWTKLRAFELYEYERVVMIDSDMLMCHNMDELFDRPLERGMIAAALACTCNPKQIPTYP
ncbi:glycosyltransferase family 8 protein, partial [Klebsiella pneumoniae]|nr:glycosyltransferase family 8 protein [Klebsiella pneumoniae]